MLFDQYDYAVDGEELKEEDEKDEDLEEEEDDEDEEDDEEEDGWLDESDKGESW